MKYSICKRDGNKKRNFVIVNPALCKHVPSNPFEIKNDLAYRLVGKTIYTDEEIFDADRIVVIGFAETATALGYFVADGIYKMVTNALVEYITTTRTRVDGEEYLEFSEAHSHATEQLINTRCLGDKEGRTKFIIVDDEITTGNTVRGLIKCIESKLEKEYIIGYDVVSALKSSDRTIEKSEIHGLDIKYIALNDIDTSDYSEFTSSMNNITGDMNNTVDEKKDTTCSEPMEITRVRKFVNMANGAPISVIHNSEAINGIIFDLENKLDFELKHADEDRKFHLDVIGTEEFMSLPIELALYLKKSLSNDKFIVTTHSTTRSPILPLVNTKSKYDIYNRVNLVSTYGDYDTYLYNTDMYDSKDNNVYSVIVTDSNKTENLECLVEHLKEKGAKRVFVYTCVK